MSYQRRSILSMLATVDIASLWLSGWGQVWIYCSALTVIKKVFDSEPLIEGYICLYMRRLVLAELSTFTRKAAHMARRRIARIQPLSSSVCIAWRYHTIQGRDYSDVMECGGCLTGVGRWTPVLMMRRDEQRRFFSSRRQLYIVSALFVLP